MSIDDSKVQADLKITLNWYLPSYRELFYHSALSKPTWKRHESTIPYLLLILVPRVSDCFESVNVDKWNRPDSQEGKTNLYRPSPQHQ